MTSLFSPAKNSMLREKAVKINTILSSRDETSFYKELHASHGEKDHSDDLENDMDGKGKFEAILKAQKERKICHK
jgi:hypothetical protein